MITIIIHTCNNDATHDTNTSRKSGFIHHHHHHHPEGVVYRSFCLNSSTVAVSEIASRRLWCIESLFPNRRELIARAARTLRIGGLLVIVERTDDILSIAHTHIHIYIYICLHTHIHIVERI